MSLPIRGKEEEDSTGLMGHSMRATGGMIKLTEKEDLFIQMVMYMKVTG